MLVWSLVWEDPPEEGGGRVSFTHSHSSQYSWSAGRKKISTYPLQYLAWKIPWMEEPGRFAVHGVAKSRTRLSDFTFTFHFLSLEKEMVTHSSVLAWRIPGTGEPGGLPSQGLHRVGHDWSDLAAATYLSNSKVPITWCQQEIALTLTSHSPPISFYSKQPSPASSQNLIKASLAFVSLGTACGWPVYPELQFLWYSWTYSSSLRYNCH